MARYRGPRLKKCRAVGAVLPGLTTRATLERPFPPGEHGTKRRRKPSDFKIRLLEKQKARWHFGILERQFQRYVVRASRMKGAAGLNLLLLLQSRLDNIVWRMGLARTIPQARQVVVHGHIQVNGRRVDRPSFHVKPGDEIKVCEKSSTKPFVLGNLEWSTAMPRPSWLEFDPAKVTGKLLGPPERNDLPFELNESAIIEFYSQKL
ncbi:MAG: 30S ribosomal protein S4 [Deltaproteobacteria bacterium]|nr:30S ribosomal protein S4 [Deltaproteobacteria bacterium]MBW2253795.1 30S ribosomal protein S4 [Deltaproteobacteria bacterium]